MSTINEYKGIVLPENADIGLVIKLLNDMRICFTSDDERAEFWKKFVHIYHGKL